MTLPLLSNAHDKTCLAVFVVVKAGRDSIKVVNDPLAVSSAFIDHR